MSPLTEYLKELRLAYCLSQEKFARLMGLEGSHVCIIEKGRRYAPGSKFLDSLIDALNLTHEERLKLIVNIEASPKKLRIPPNSPAAAFRLIALLESRWSEFSEEEFSTLYDNVRNIPSHSRVIE